MEKIPTMAEKHSTKISAIIEEATKKRTTRDKKLDQHPERPVSAMHSNTDV